MNDLKNNYCNCKSEIAEKLCYGIIKYETRGDHLLLLIEIGIW